MLDVTLGLALALCAACDQAPARRAPEAADVSAPPPAHRAGPAYLAVDHAGVLRLDDGGFTRVLAHRFPIRSLAIAPDGALLVAAIGGAWRLDGPRIERLTPPGHLPLERITAGPDGVVWATDRRSVWRWDGRWAEEPAATFDGALVDDLAVDARGHVWVVQAAALWRLAGDGWHQVDLAFTGTTTPFLSAIRIAPDGAPIVGGQAGVFAYRDGAWRDLALPHGSLGADELEVGPAGHLATSGGLRSIVLAAPTGRVRALDLADGPMAARRGDVLAVDGAGRTWLTTDEGLLVLDADGGVLTQWRPGTVPDVIGRVTAVAVVDDGPTLPAPGPARTGTVTGTLPAATAAVVELCDRPLPVFTTSPCDGATRMYRATVARDGAFTITGVPAGSYGLAVRTARGWVLPTEPDCCTQLATDDRVDLGRLSVR